MNSQIVPNYSLLLFHEDVPKLALTLALRGLASVIPCKNTKTPC